MTTKANKLHETTKVNKIKKDTMKSIDFESLYITKERLRGTIVCRAR